MPERGMYTRLGAGGVVHELRGTRHRDAREGRYGDDRIRRRSQLTDALIIWTRPLQAYALPLSHSLPIPLVVLRALCSVATLCTSPLCLLRLRRYPHMVEDIPR